MTDKYLLSPLRLLPLLIISLAIPNIAQAAFINKTTADGPGINTVHGIFASGATRLRLS